LQEFDFEIKYRPGRHNVVAGRKPSLCAITIVSNPLPAEVREKLSTDEFFSSIISLLHQESKTPKEINKVQGYKWEDNCLYFNNRMCIPNNSELRRKILIEAHDILTA